MAKEKISVIREFRTLGPHIKKYRRAYAAGLGFLILTDAGQIMIPRLMGSAVDLIAGGTGNAAAVGRLMLGIAGLAVLIALGRYGWRNFIIGTARRIETDLRDELYGKLLSLTESFYIRSRVGDLMARATNDLKAVRMATGMALIAFIDGVFMLIVILTTLFINYGKLGVIIVLPLPLVTFMALFIGKLIGPLFRGVQENFSHISEHVQETLAGIRVIKSFAIEKRALDTFSRINRNYGRANMALVRFWGMLFPSMSFIAGLTVLLLLYFGGQQLIRGQLSPGEFVTALSYLGMLLWPAMGAGWVVNMLQRGAASMKRINTVLSEIPDIVDLPGASEEIPAGSLDFRSLNYSYGDSGEVLKDITFTVESGSSTGILGKTGCGKSTLIKLIPRLLDPPERSIFIGGTDIRAYSRAALRKALGVVPQDVFLFSETIRENILFADPDASETELNEVVEAAGLAADLPFFPDGIETRVGEKGVTLSGGQKQRIAIARALIGKPEILILDDALSAVDAETEERILTQLFRIRRGRTTLMVSHRVSALARCDECIVMEDGVVSASGTHDELISVPGFYREIFELQKLEGIAEELT